jgi:hypothetical protein
MTWGFPLISGVAIARTFAFPSPAGRGRAPLSSVFCLPLPRLAGEGAPAGAGEGVVPRGEAANFTPRLVHAPSPRPSLASSASRVRARPS